MKMQTRKCQVRDEMNLGTVMHDKRGDYGTSYPEEQSRKDKLLSVKSVHGTSVLQNGAVLPNINKTRIGKASSYRNYPHSIKWRDPDHLNPDSRLESIRTTIKLMGGQSDRQKTTNKHDPVTEFGENAPSSTGESTSETSKPISETQQQDASSETANRRHLTKHHRRKRGMMGAKFKRLAKFLTILFGLWKKHAERVQRFLQYSVDFLDVERPTDLMFDVTEFKTAKQARVPSEVKRILMKPGKDRTADEVKKVQVALGNYQPIAEYPLIMTSLMAQRAWYEGYTPKRVIIKQGHPPRCYYFILSGSVVLTKMDEDGSFSKTECFLGRGESFGDWAIVNKSPRETTVISRENVELLVFGDEDYTEIFMSGGLNDPEHPLFRSLYCLRGWPTGLLADNPDNAILSYFKRGTILVYDSKYNDWIFIVKSGSCSVLKKLRNSKPSVYKPTKVKVKTEERSHRDILAKKLAEADDEREKKSFIFRQKLLQDLGLGIELIPVGTKKWDPIEEEATMTINEQKTKNVKLSTSGPFLTKTNMTFNAPAGIPQENKLKADAGEGNNQSGQAAIPEIYIEDVPPEERVNPDIYLPQRQSGFNKKTIADGLNERYLSTGHLLTPADRDPLFIRVRTLTKGSTFGLSDYIHNDQPKLSLVSNGAECIVIRKKFYLDYVSKELLAILKAEVTPYPTDEELQNMLQQHLDWLFSRRKLVETIKRENRLQRINVHDARSIVQ